MNRAFGSNLSGNAEPACRQTHVNAEMDMLDRRVQSLSENAGILAERLSPVLRMEPNGNEAAKAERDHIVPLAADLRRHRESLDTIDDLIKAIIRQLEI